MNRLLAMLWRESPEGRCLCSRLSAPCARARVRPLFAKCQPRGQPPLIADLPPILEVHVRGCQRRDGSALSERTDCSSGFGPGLGLGYPQHCSMDANGVAGGGQGDRPTEMRTQFSLGVLMRVRQFVRSADKHVQLVACCLWERLEYLRAAIRYLYGPSAAAKGRGGPVRSVSRSNRRAQSLNGPAGLCPRVA